MELYKFLVADKEIEKLLKMIKNHLNNSNI